MLWQWVKHGRCVSARSLHSTKPNVLVARRSFACTRRALQQQQPACDPVTGIPLGGDTMSTSSKVQKQTAMIYLDNVFPLRMNILDIRQIFFRNTKKCLDTTTRKVLPTSEVLGHGFGIESMEPRSKDGGAILRFSFESSIQDKKRIASEIAEKVAKHLEENRTVAPFNLQRLRAFLVKGEPFLEDILARYPTPRLRIEFQGAGEPVPVEKLYKHLRPYGRIYDIALYPNPHVSKDPPRYAIIQFTRVRSATSARNCLHGHVIHGSRLNILYERQLHTNVVKEWVVNHPRITIPAVAALLAGLTYSVFDPIRIFFVTSKITQRFNPEEYALYRWLRRETWARLVQKKPDHHVDHKALWQDDAEDVEKVRGWLRETPQTFIVVTGPKGSGKSSLVKAAIEDRRNKIFIDCEELASTRNQSETTAALAKQLGYFPVFTWVASASKLLETVVVASTGQKTTGLMSSPDAQIRKILETAAIALRDVKGTHRQEQEQDKESATSSLLETLRRRLQNLLLQKNDDITEKVARDLDQEEKKDPHDAGENIPVVVIDNFMYRETAKNELLWEELANFASLLVENEVAHVVFVSSNVGVNKILSKALPGKSFETIMLSDAPPEVALSFISRQLGEEIKVDEELHSIVNALGGRLTELELLVQKMKMHMSAKTAFEDIVQRNVIEIRKYGFNEASDVDENALEWTAIQFWEIVKNLAQKKSINYNELKWGPFFKGQDKALRAMERAELITIHYKDGRPNAIRPGKPVMYTVFSRLVSDPVFAASMEIETNQYLKNIAEESLEKLQGTVESLSRIYNGKPPREIDTRIRYLLGKIASTQKLIETYEAKINEAKGVVSNTWKDCGS